MLSPPCLPSFPHAESLVQDLGTAVDGEHVENHVPPVLPGLVDKRTDQAGTDTAALMIRVDFDAGKVDLARTVLDIDHADVCIPQGDDLPAARIEGTSVELALDPLIPPPRRSDIVAQGGLMQLIAELASAGMAGRSMTVLMPPPIRARSVR
jgi:hypothetical protein